MEARWWPLVSGLTKEDLEYFSGPFNHAPSSYRGRASCDFVLGIDEPLPFRLRRGAPPFGVFRGSMVRVVVPRASEALNVTADSAGVVLNGVVAPGDLAFHPTFPLELDGIAVLNARATLAVSGTSTFGLLNVSYRLPSDEDFVVSPMTLRAQVDCNDVTLEKNAFSHKGGLSLSVPAVYLLEPDAGLARAPGGVPFARARPGRKIVVSAIDWSGDYFQVLAYRETDTLIGWTREVTEPPEEGIGRGTVGTRGHGAGTGTGRGFLTDVVTCPRDVPLSIEQGKTSAKVGIVRKGKSMILREKREDTVVVDFEGSTRFEIDESARYLVQKTDLEGCRPPGRRKKPPPEHRPNVWPRERPGIVR